MSLAKSLLHRLFGADVGAGTPPWTRQMGSILFRYLALDGKRKYNAQLQPVMSRFAKY